MDKEIKQLLETATNLKNKLELNINKSVNELDKITDEKTLIFLKNSITLAKNGTLDVQAFLNESKKHVENANRNTRS